MRARDLMHAGPALPRVSLEAKVPEVIHEISSHRLGMTTVTDAGGALAGVVTDGDLRRLMEQRRGDSFELTAKECLTAHPVTIGPEEFASAALHLMEQRKITSVIVSPIINQSIRVEVRFLILRRCQGRLQHGIQLQKISRQYYRVVAHFFAASQSLDYIIASNDELHLSVHALGHYSNFTY